MGSEMCIRDSKFIKLCCDLVFFNQYIMNVRFKKGQIAEQCFKDLLNKKKIPFVKMGREFQIKNKQIESFLNKDNSPTAAAVRYSPDFLLLKNGLWFAEIKHSRTIEFNCYMNYKRLEESGCNIIIIFLDMIVELMWH